MAEFYFTFSYLFIFLNDNRILLKEIEQYKRTKLNSHQHKPPNNQTKTEHKSGKKHISRSPRIGRRRLNQTIRLRMGASYHMKERCFKCIAPYQPVPPHPPRTKEPNRNQNPSNGKRIPFQNNAPEVSSKSLRKINLNSFHFRPVD